MNYLMEITGYTAGISVYVLNGIMTVVVPSAGKEHISSVTWMELV